MNVNWVLLLHTNINLILSRNKPGVILVFETSFEILKYNSKKVILYDSYINTVAKLFVNVFSQMSPWFLEIHRMHPMCYT